MMFEFGEYGFIKWKFENQYFRSVEALAWSIENGKKKKNPGVSRCLDHYSIRIRLIEKSTWSIERNFRPIKTRKTKFSIEFSSDCSERLKRFQVLWTFLWNILTLHTCLLMKYNLMGINRGLCSQNRKLATIVWGAGGQILSKKKDIKPSSYLFSICLLC